MTHSFKARAAALAGVAALSLGSAAVLAAPANAATAPLRYTCTANTSFGVLNIPVDVVLGTDLPAAVPPATAVAVNATADVTVQGELTPGNSYADLFRGIADKVKGSAVVATTLDGAAKSSTLTVAEQTLSKTGPLTIKAAGPLYTVTTGAAGATHTIAADNFSVTIDMFKDGAPAGVPNIKLECVKPATGDLTASKTTVDAAAPIPVPAPADTTTSVKAKAKKGVITAKIAVTGATDGKVKVSVKGPKKFKKTVTVTLKGGKGVAKIKKATVKGKYKLTAALAASATAKASTGKTTVTVK